MEVVCLFRTLSIPDDLVSVWKDTISMLFRLKYCHYYIIYNKPTRCNSGSIVFIKNYKYALHVSDALCIHHQEHYKL